MARKNGNSWGLYDPRPPYHVSPISLYDQVNRDRWILSNGSLGWNTASELMQRSTRERYSRSPSKLIPGTSSTWRKPTQYERLIFSQRTAQNLHYLRRSSTEVPLGEQRITPLPTTETSPSRGRFGGPGWVFYHSTNITGLENPDIVNARDRAVTECLLKLGDNKVDIGTALAESVKTVNHLASTAVDIGRAYSALRGKRWKEMLNILSKRSPLHRRKITAGKTATQYWLEYNYAWKPLFYEAYGLVELLKVQLEPAMLVHASRTIEDRMQHHVPYGPTGPGFGSWYDIYWSLTKGTVKYAATCRLTGRINSTSLRMAAMGLTNPAAVAWELVPYSFVVDWAIPVGNVLAAATATRGLTFVGGSVTSRYQAHGLVSFCGKSYHLQLREGVAEWMKFHMRRDVFSSFPKPVFYAKSPFSTSHVVSALALVRQLL